VVKDAMNHPLLDVDYRGASGGLVHITGGPDLTLKEAEGIAQNITERLEASANVIWGARIQEEYKGKVRVMAIMTGVQSAQILGPTTQKQANASRRAIEGAEGGQGQSQGQPGRSGSFEASGSGSGNFDYGETDGGESELEKNNGLDVIR
jgi:cell division protein FtsZ